MGTIDRYIWLSSVAVSLLACGSDDPKKPPAQSAHAGAVEVASTDASSRDALDAGAPTDGAVAAPEGCPLTPPTSCPNPMPHYADITPILMERCFPCHDGKGEQWGLTSYEHVADWFSEIRASMIACSMPPLDAGTTMPVSERMKIVTWIRCGYPK